MKQLTQKQIASEINHYSNGDSYLGELLSYCIGRLCLKSAKSGALWRKELSSIDIPHVVDWLKAAIINDDAWLKNVDEKNRPKKLMKFGSFEDIQKEADKAMRITNQKNSDIKLVEGDEELYMQLNDGYYLVKLLTPAALDREGSQMQHCIGAGAYDEALNSDEHYFLSLRDGHGKPHATLEVKGNGLEQLQGKQNQAPNIKYTRMLKPFFAETKLAINIPICVLGYVICSNGIAHEINNLPKNLQINGSLNLDGVPIKALPEGLKINGGLTIEDTLIKELPQSLKVDDFLYLTSSLVEKIPENFTVGGSLFLEDSLIKELPTGLTIGRDLDFSHSEIKSLPEDIKIGGDIDFQYSTIENLPDNLTVPGNLNLYKTKIKKLPNKLKVGSNLDLSFSTIKSLPENLEVGEGLYFMGTNISSIPKTLIVGGNLDLSHTEVTSLPQALKIGGSLIYVDTNIRELPSDLQVGGEIKDSNGDIKTLNSHTPKNNL